MKTVSPALAEHLAGEVTSLARCWKLTRRDTTILGFTDMDRDIVHDGITYIASSGFNASAVASSADLAVDNLDVEGMLESDGIAREDILSGLYDYARIDIFLVNHQDTGQGILALRTGWLGEVTLQGGQFTAEMRGLTQRLAQPIGELYSPACRAKLGDARCKVDLEAHRFSGTVTAAEDGFSFKDSARAEANGSFNSGQVTFTTGANAGRSMEIKEFINTQFLLALPMPYAIAPGDEYEAVRGCDKTLATCRDVFANAVNFRGEPHIPGLGQMLETAGTRKG